MFKRNKNIEPTFEPAKPSGHKAFNDTNPYAYQASHRRSIMLLRFITGYSIVATCAVAFQSIAIYELMPLKTVEVALIRADPETDKIYRIEPLNKTVPGFMLVLEAISRDVVPLLLEIDEVTQDNRFSEARRFSDVRFFNSFLNDNKTLIENALKDGLNRSVAVETANLVSEKNGVYQFAVDFVRTDILKDEDPEVKKLRAYLLLTTRPQEVTSQDKFSNPLGVRVLNMTVKLREAT